VCVRWRAQSIRQIDREILKEEVKKGIKKGKRRVQEYRGAKRVTSPDIAPSA